MQFQSELTTILSANQQSLLESEVVLENSERIK